MNTLFSGGEPDTQTIYIKSAFMVEIKREITEQNRRKK
jgi:hypothetical protein